MLIDRNELVDVWCALYDERKDMGYTHEAAIEYADDHSYDVYMDICERAADAAEYRRELYA